MTFVVWMTGLPCSGKTTIVRAMQKQIPNLAILDGDELREWLSPKDFSKEGRVEHNKKVAHLAKLLLNHGHNQYLHLNQCGQPMQYYLFVHSSLLNLHHYHLYQDHKIL